MALFKNPSTTNFIVAGFFVLILLFLSCEVRSETTFEAGITVLNTSYSEGENIILTERWDDKWEFGIGLIGEQIDKYNRPIDSNMLIFAQRKIRGTDALDDVILGVGLAYLDKTTTVSGSNLNFMLSLEWNRNRDDWFPDYYIFRHVSNAGTTRPNTGQNVLNVGYNFGL
jgi:hypothetical protein